MNGARQRGRPASKDLDARLVDAAVELLEQTGSFDAVSIDALCRQAGASKASFYRRWHDRGGFILHMMNTLRMPPLPEGPTGSLRGDLVDILEGMFGTDVHRTRVVHSAMVLEGRKNRDLIGRYLRETVQPRREALMARLRRGVIDGALRADTDIPILHEALTAPVLKIMLLQDPATPIPKDFARRVVDQVLRGAAQDLDNV